MFSLASAASAPASVIRESLVVVQPDAHRALQQNSVIAMVEDRRGHVWLATQSALHRFDGHDLVVPPVPGQNDDARVLAHAPVTALTTTPDGAVWIGTLGEGLLRHDPDSGDFQSAARLGLKDAERHRRIQALRGTPQGIYFSTPSGLFFWGQGEAGAVPVLLEGKPVLARRVWWLGRETWVQADTGLFRITEKQEATRVTDPAFTDSTDVMLQRPDGALVAFGRYGVLVREASAQAFRSLTLSAYQAASTDRGVAFVSDAAAEADGTVWAAMPGRGVLEWRADGRSVWHRPRPEDPAALPEAEVVSVLVDSAGRLWLGMLTRGFAYRAEGHPWLHALKMDVADSGSGGNNIFALLPDGQDGLWVGTEGAGLRHQTASGELRWHNEPLARAGNGDAKTGSSGRLFIRALLRQDDFLWVGHTRGLWRYWPATGKAEAVLADVLVGDLFRSAVRALQPTRAGDLLIASDTAGLLIRSKDGRVRRYHKGAEPPFTLPTNRVLDVREDREGQLWLATDDGLLRIGKDGVAREIEGAERLPTRFINTLLVDKQGDVWAGTFAGVVRLQLITAARPEVTVFGREQGLRDGVIYALLEDVAGDVWASTNTGLMRYRRSTGSWRHYGRKDGLADDEFNLNAAHALADGRLMFGGLSGLSVVEPAREPLAAASQTLSVNAWQVADQPLHINWGADLPDLQLAPDAGLLRLRLAVPGAPLLQRQRFFFRYDGEDRWQRLGEGFQIDLPGLQPGQHQLELAWSHGALPESASRVLEFEVKAHWWQRPATAIASLAALLSVAAIWWWSRRRVLLRQQQAEAAAHASDERLRMALWGTGDALWDWHLRTGRVIRTGMTQLLGYAESEVEDTLYWRDRLLHPQDVATTTLALQRHLDGQSPYYEAEYRLRTPAAEWMWVLDRGQIVERDGHGQALRMAGTMRNINERHRRDEELRYLANYDALTGLPNRTLFMERLEHALAAARRQNHRLAVMFIDLDRFKNVNDSFGHGVGDRLLRAVAQRLRECVRESDTVARLGGDEFTVLLENVAAMSAVHRVAETLLRACAQPFELEGHPLLISPSIGISVYPDDADSAERLINHADMAMYGSKEKGRNTYRFFESSMNEQALRRAAISLALRQARENNELYLHFQPRMALASRQIIGFEALLRWRSASLGEVSPGEFIPVAEEIGLIVSLGDWVIERVCRHMRDWRETPMAGLPVAVNVSIRQLTDGNLPVRILSCLQRYELAAKLLQVEVTESLLMDNIDLAINVLEQLRELGMAIAIDDFGTGYSSLAYLQRLPIDAVKIDQSFVRTLNPDGDEGTIIRAIIALAHSLKLSVTAEGVETAAQLEFLSREGCDEMQGYWLSRPVPEEQLPALLARPPS